MSSTGLGFDSCSRARRAIHVVMDGDPLEDEEQSWLERHLEGCGECREVESDMNALQQALRGLSMARLPDRVLEDLFARTSRSGRPSSGLVFRLAAAAVLAACLIGFWQWTRTPEAAAEISELQLQQAAAEARLVLGLTGQALHQTERAAIRQILGQEVSNALRRVPIVWPDGDPGDMEKRRKSRT